MKRRNFIKKAGLAAAGITGVPYILPTGRLFAATGNWVVNHVMYVLFAGGIRNQESVGQQFLMNWNASLPEGNVMNNMLTGAAPSSNAIHDPWTPVLNMPMMEQGTLFKEVGYKTGPTGHYNGHTVAEIKITGELNIVLNYTILIDENNNSETTTFKIRIKDRAGNWSNEVETGVITVLE